MKASDILFKKAPVFVFLIIFTAIFGTAPENSSAVVHDMQLPIYGSGAIQVRIYTDYIRPPCQAIEPVVEPLRKDLINKNIIRLTLIDVPFIRNSPMYAGYFLYALNAKHDKEQALRVKNVPFTAATDKHSTTNEKR